MNYRGIARQLPASIRERVRKTLIYADIDTDHEKFLGFMVTFGLALSLAVSMDLYLVFDVPPLTGFAGTVVSFLLLVYIWLFFLTQNRSRFIENVLPDALQLMSSNIRAGMTTDRALLLSARAEFGPLRKEISLVGKRIFSGGVIEEELKKMAERVNSKVFRRTIGLIVEGIRSGGSLDRLLIQTADDLRGQESIRKEIQATVLMYSILIFFAVGFAAPFLFGVSSYLSEVLSTRMNSFSFVRGVSSTLNLQNTAPSIPVETLLMFSVTSLSLSSVFGGLAIGLIQEGEEKVGVKYIPLFIASSLLVFLITRNVMVSVFGQLLG